MKEIKRISTRDLELLSAYLDGELAAPDLDRLLPRLEREPRLKQALEEMKAVVQQLGALPEAALPRSFTLTPRTAGIRSRSRIYPVFQLATALAAVVFVALVGVDAFTGQFSMASRAVVMSDVVGEAQVVAPQAEAELGAGETFAQGGEADALAEEEVPGAIAAPAVEAPEQLEEALRTETSPSPQPSAEKAVAGETTIGEGAAEQTAEPSADEHLATPVAENLNAVAQTPEAEAVSPGDVNRAYAQETTGSWGPAVFPILRVLEIGFGALVLLLGGLTLWIRYKRT